QHPRRAAPLCRSAGLRGRGAGGQVLARAAVRGDDEQGRAWQSQADARGRGRSRGLPEGARRRVTGSGMTATREGSPPAASFFPEVPAVLDLVPGPDDFLQPVFVGAVATVHVGMQVLHEALVLAPDLDLRPAVLRLEDVERAALRRWQLPPDRAAGVLRGVGAEKLHRILDAEPRPGAVLHALAPEGLGLAPPEPVLVEEFLELLVGLALEEVPFQIVFAHMVAAEPEEIVEVVGRFRRPVLACRSAAGMVA